MVIYYNKSTNRAFIMKHTKNSLVESLNQAIKLAENDLAKFKEQLTITHDFGSHHGALISEFNILYSCPFTGHVFKLYDTMLWNDTNDIILNGLEAYEVSKYEEIKEFHNNERLYLSETGEWVNSSKDEISSLLGDMANIYRHQIKVTEYLPDWPNLVVTKIKETYQLED